MSVEEYLNKLKLHVKDIIIDLQEYDASKIQLTTAINFISPKIPTKPCIQKVTIWKLWLKIT